MSMHRSRLSSLSGIIFFSILILFTVRVAGAVTKPQIPPAPNAPDAKAIRYYEPAGDAHLDLPDERGIQRHLTLRGEQWTYRTSFGKDKEVQQKSILDWLSAQTGGSVLAATLQDVVGRMQPNVNERLTYHFRISRDTTDVRVYRERLLIVDHPLVITLDPKGQHRVSFWVEHDGRRYQSLAVEFEHKDVVFKGTIRSRFDNYERTVRHEHTCRIEHGSRQEVFDLPQYAGIYEWVVSTHAQKAQKVRISLQQGPVLPTLKDGAHLGGLRVRNLPVGSVRLKAEWDARLGHPNFELSKMHADRTPEGDTIFWVPSGYWQLEAHPPNNAGLSVARAHMIPVHAGRITVVDWPRSLSRIFAPKAEGRLEIMDARQSGENVEVDISLMELDGNIVPASDRIQCYEGGQAGKVLSVERLKSPLHLVLLLDSSGSMKGSMAQAAQAVKSFIQRFPETAHVTIVDFDTKPKMLKAHNRKELLRALGRVRANGATALFDSILLGLDQLKTQSRRALVVFTDGMDANWNDTGPGSKATKEEVMKAVEKAETPIFTIGFGQKPDVDTLTRMAEQSGGAYYQAHDASSLDNVFSRISANLGRHYRVTYQRPKRVGLSDVPVMALVVDNSGSMDLDPKRKGCDFRIVKVKQILGDFTRALPDDFLAQLLTFTDDTRVSQVLTAKKTPLLRGLSLMHGEGGTDILGSINAALQTLKTVPSSRRYLVYLTDAAMKVEKKQLKKFNILLSSLRDEGIQCLFIGVVDADKDGAFAHAAKMSGGRFVISTDLGKVKKAFDDMASQVSKPRQEQEHIALRLTLSDRDTQGRNRLFSAGRFVDFSQAEQVTKGASPEAIAWTIGEPLTVYDDIVGSKISGSDLLIREVRVDKRIPLQVSGSNAAMTLSASEMVFLSRLRGLNAPSGYRYLAIPLDLTNRLKPQKVAVFKDGSSHPAAWMAGAAAPVRYEQTIPPYLIPDFTRHLFLRWNREITLPVSPATWLSQEPLVLPGERAILVSPGQPVSGACVFLVPDGEMTQASLHFYDVNYGAIDLPLTGIMPVSAKQSQELPTHPDKGLGSSFALRITGRVDQGAIGQIKAGQGYVFRIIEAHLTSKVQALLKVNPAERFSYHLPTKQGDLVFRLHPATEYLPLGFYRPTMMAPGAGNMIRLAFRLPEKMASEKEEGFLFVDVRGGGVRLDLDLAAKKPADLGKPDIAGPGVDIVVNAAGPVKGKVAGQRGKIVALDLTFSDRKDGSHTRLGPLVVLKKKGTGSVNQKIFDKRLADARFKAATKKHRGLGDFGKTGVSGPAAASATGVSRAQSLEDKLIFGLDEKSVIFDGQTRRGLMVFKLPDKEKISDWELSSLVVDNVSMPVPGKAFEKPELLSERLGIENRISDRFWSELKKKVAVLQARRAAEGYRRLGEVRANSVTLDTADLGKERVPVPGSVAPGAYRLQKVVKEADVLKLISSLTWIPGPGSSWAQRYSPEAVLTQGWGDPSDLAGLAERLLNNQGFVTMRAEVRPTEQGRKKLAKLAGLDSIKIDSLPALRYEGRDGRKHFIVFPWCRELDGLEGLVRWDGSNRSPSDRREKVRIQVELELQPVASGNTEGTRMAATALAGGETAKMKRLRVLDESFYNDEAGMDAFDIGYTEIQDDGRPALQCILDGPLGRRVGYKNVDLNAWTVVSEHIVVSMDRHRNTIVQQVDPSHPITGRFHVLAVNAPDLGAAETTELQALRSKTLAGVTSPDGLSALQWYGHSVIDRFIAAQTRYERQLARTLHLKVGRTMNGRCILVSMQKSDAGSDLSTRMDLVHAANDIHANTNKETQRASRAFALLSGLAAARLEAAAIPKTGMGLFELWDRTPKETKLVYIDSENKKAFVDMLKAKGFPKSLITSIETCRKAIIFPSNPAIIDDKPRWGWLEIDPKTYEVVSRLDNQAAGALVESLLDDIHMQAGTYLVGALVGIDASLWSVSAFSLELEDFDEIREKAEAFAMGLAKRFQVKNDSETLGVEIGGTPSAEYGFGRYVKFSLDFSGFKKSQNMLGFGNGYKDAVGYYFSQFKE